MNNNILKNIFSPQEPQTRYGRIIKRLAKGRYQVEDVQGQKFIVTSETSWGLQDGISFQAGRITGASMLTKSKNYEV